MTPSPRKRDDPWILAEVSITPLGQGDSVSSYVARSIAIIEKSGLDYRLGPMGTCIEGPWNRVFETINRCRRDLSHDTDRVSISIKVDWRRGRRGALRSKVESVERHLERPPGRT